MARKEDDIHWLLRRQVSDHPQHDSPPNFLHSISTAYRVFDQNYLRIKLILRRKILQLVQTNAELQQLLKDKNSEITANEERQQKLIVNLSRAEVLAHLGSFTWDVQDSRIDFSENLCELLHLNSTTGNALSLLRKFDDTNAIFQAFKTASLLNPTIGLEGLKLKHELRYFNLQSQFIFDAQGKVVQISGILKENTKLVHINNRAEDQKRFYESILNNIPVDIAIFNADHKYLYLNPIAVNNQEVRDFLLGRDDFDYCRLRNLDTTKAQLRRDVFLQAKSSKVSVQFEDNALDSEGNIRYMLRSFYPVLNAEGDFSFMIGYGMLITTMKKQELSLEHSLREREALLGEVHHSVKNNLTLIVALLEINSTHEKDVLVKKYFYEIRNRISAMALIYDRLYRSDVFNRINLHDYITTLTHSLLQTLFPLKPERLKLNLDEIYVDNKNAVPLALLINELVSNALVHGLAQAANPRLLVSLKETNGVTVLVIADNGPGLPEHVDYTKGKSFGFKLISLFTRQLKGKMSLTKDSGLRVEIVFQNLNVKR